MNMIWNSFFNQWNDYQDESKVVLCYFYTLLVVRQKILPLNFDQPDIWSFLFITDIYWWLHLTEQLLPRPAKADETVQDSVM